jgi:hypothetical protein
MFDRMTFFQVVGFCSRKPVTDSYDMESAARKRAMQVLGKLRLDPPLAELGDNVARVYRECVNREDLQTAACRACRLVGSLVVAGVEDESAKAELARIAGECSAGISPVDF